MDKCYVASFFTMLGAVEFHECLQKLGDIQAKMIPVPRQVSVSCGTGVMFSLPFNPDQMFNPDLDSVYLYQDGKYTKEWSQEG